jgi:hypothetical protein
MGYKLYLDFLEINTFLTYIRLVFWQRGRKFDVNT